MPSSVDETPSSTEDSVMFDTAEELDVNSLRLEKVPIKDDDDVITGNVDVIPVDCVPGLPVSGDNNGDSDVIGFMRSVSVGDVTS